MGTEKAPPVAYCFDRFTLDLARGALLASNGTELSLRPKSFALLRFFVENAGRLVDRDAIMSTIWPDVIVTDDSITQCVSDIRRVFGDDAQHLLRTVQRRGYRFTAAVTHADATSPLVPARDETGASLDDEPKGPIDPNSAPEDAPSLAGQQSSRRSDPETVSSTHPPGRDDTQPVRPPLIPVAERRHLTVLLCDLVGSTELSEQ